MEEENMIHSTWSECPAEGMFTRRGLKDITPFRLKDVGVVAYFLNICLKSSRFILVFNKVAIS